VGLALGDLASGLLSQVLASRKRALLAFHVLMALSVGAYFAVGPRSSVAFYACCAAVGFASGYWAVFVTTAAEQFGTNLRATATTSAPNFVRWSAAGSALLWHQFEAVFGGGSGAESGDPSAAWRGAALVGAILIPVAMVAAMAMRETFGSSLDWTERGDGTREDGPDARAAARS
jgi:hypothetical protein